MNIFDNWEPVDKGKTFKLLQKINFKKAKYKLWRFKVSDPYIYYTYFYILKCLKISFAETLST